MGNIIIEIVTNIFFSKLVNLDIKNFLSIINKIGKVNKSMSKYIGSLKSKKLSK